MNDRLSSRENEDRRSPETLENGTALEVIVYDGKIIPLKPLPRVQPPPSFETLVASPLEVRPDGPTQHARADKRWSKLWRWLKHY